MSSEPISPDDAQVTSPRPSRRKLALPAITEEKAAVAIVEAERARKKPEQSTFKLLPVPFQFGALKAAEEGEMGTARWLRSFDDDTAARYLDLLEAARSVKPVILPVPDQDDGRPMIVITTEQHEVIDEAVIALARDVHTYKRNFALVTVRRTEVPRNGIDRPVGTPRICQLPIPTLRERLAKHAAWVSQQTTRKGDPKFVPSHPPTWAVAGVDARGQWPQLRHLEAIVEAPILRHDGTILDEPGYDATTGILYEPNAVFPKVDRSPSRDDAKAAADQLLDLVIDFPFVSDQHRAAWLAALLTPVARFAVDGCTPLFLFEGSVAGSGKTKLADLISIIRSGRTIARKDYPFDNDEVRKTITSVALDGDAMMLFDNITVPFGCSALDIALTGPVWQDRLLGTNTKVEIPLPTVFYASGNNIQIRSDIMRRIIPCRLAPNEERPEERGGFKYPNLLKTALEMRPQLVVAALTILRGYIAAGRPSQGVKPLGSYEEWTALVASAVVWSTGFDPLGSREAFRAADEASSTAAAIVEGWDELPEGRYGYTVGAVVKLLKAGDCLDRFGLLRNAFLEWSRNDDLPNSKIIGSRLRSLRGRVINGKCLDTKETMDRNGVQIWYVRSVSELPCERQEGRTP
jgi:hypothetical protein